MELTRENLYAFFKSTIEEDGELETTKNIQIRDQIKIFDKLVIRLLNQFYPDYKTNSNISDKRIYFQGGRVFINPQCKSAMFNNVTELFFVDFYPNIIIKLTDTIEDGKDIIDRSFLDPFGEEDWSEDSASIIWNIPDYFKIFKFIVENKEDMKSFGDTLVDTFIRVLINWTYGSIVGSNRLLKINNPGIISKAGVDILDIFIENYPNNVIYADTQEIFFINYEEIKDEINLQLEKIGFKYEIRNINTVVLLDRKKYIESDDLNLKTRGIRKIIKLRSNSSIGSLPGRTNLVRFGGDLPIGLNRNLV